MRKTQDNPVDNPVEPFQVPEPMGHSKLERIDGSGKRTDTAKQNIN